MKGSVKRIVIGSTEGAFYFDVYDCGRVIIDVWRERSLKQHPCKSGYLRVWATATDGKRKNFMVHRLVAMAHLEYKTNYELLDVNHKDGNKSNNDCDNLEWVTRSENLTHAYKNGLFKNKKESSDETRKAQARVRQKRMRDKSREKINKDKGLV